MSQVLLGFSAPFFMQISISTYCIYNLIRRIKTKKMVVDNKEIRDTFNDKPKQVVENLLIAYKFIKQGDTLFFMLGL